MKNIQRMKMAGVVVLAVLFIAGALNVSAWTAEKNGWTITGNTDELDAIMSEDLGMDFGGITNYDSLTLSDDLVVGGTTTFNGGFTSTGGVNYTDLSKDTCAIVWIDCDESASSTSVGDLAINNCDYQNETGATEFITAEGFVISSGSASVTAALNTYHGTASTTSSQAADLYDVDIGYPGLAGLLTTEISTATSSASLFDAFVLPSESVIFATTTDEGDFGTIEESIVSMWFRSCVPTSTIADADLDS